MNDRTIHDELEEIRGNDPDGLLYPNTIVEYARNENTLLHERFEWDDEIAGENYRIWQARQLIVRVKIEAIKGHIIQAYVSLTSDRSDGGYRSMVEVLQDDDASGELLMDALEEFKRLEEKYKELKELRRIFQDIDAIRRKKKARTVKV